MNVINSLVCISLLCWGTASALAQEAIFLQHRWEIEPNLNCEWIVPDPADASEFAIDFTQLNAPVVEYRLAEARRLVEIGDQVEAGERVQAIADILKQLRDGQENRQVRQALVSACVKLTAAEGSHSQELWELCRDDSALQGYVETALMERRSSLAKEVWLKRLAAPRTDARLLMLAIEGVSAIDATESNGSLQNLIQSDATTSPLKLAAARSLGKLAKADLELLASEWLASNRPFKEQVAANLLVNHSSDAAQEIMSQVLDSSLAPAQVLAYRWFAEHRLDRAKELAADMLAHPDNSARVTAVKVLNQFDDVASLRLQAELLQDSNTTVRRTVRDHLIEKARLESLLPVVDEVLTQHLFGEKYQGAEQAILVVAALGQKERCPQLVKLLEHPRPEVHIRAAWALQELVDDPTSLAQILEHCQIWTDRIANFNPQKRVEDTDVVRLSFLFEALGRNAYQPADEMLRLYVPKNHQMMRATTRISAVWALGQIWKGRSDSGLEQPLVERLLDSSIIEPEEDPVRYTAAVALAYIGTPSVVEQMKTSRFRPPYPVGIAVDWAVEKLGGQATAK